MLRVNIEMLHVVEIHSEGEQEHLLIKLKSISSLCLGNVRVLFQNKDGLSLYMYRDCHYKDKTVMNSVWNSVKKVVGPHDLNLKS